MKPEAPALGKGLYLAEGVGFEPTVAADAHNGFQDRPFVHSGTLPVRRLRRYYSMGPMGRNHPGHFDVAGGRRSASGPRGFRLAGASVMW